MGWCAAAVIVLATISALAWRSFDLSWGWIVRFAAGAALAIVIAHRFTPAMVRQTLVGLLTVAVLSLALTIWHRADRGYAHFSWPIGPITIVGGLAAVWAALAGIWGVGLAMQGRWTGAVLTLGACALCLYALQQTERRSPTLGLVAGIVIVAAIVTWRRYPSLPVQFTVCAVIAAIVIGGIAYVWTQTFSPMREISGPIEVRRTYWKNSRFFIWNHPIFGVGPDRFVIEMTRLMADFRAHMPHRYHGNLDTATHNEWLQAAVELGLPAGLAFAALPIAVLVIGLRSAVRRDSSKTGTPVEDKSHRLLAGATRGLAWPLAAAIITLFVCEAASINLRGSIMPIWYWALLGLLGATISVVPSDVNQQSVQLARRRLRPFLVMAGGFVFLVASFSESLAAVEEARGIFPAEHPAPSRFFVERTLRAQYASAAQASALAQESSTPENDAKALERWREMFQVLPVYRETATNYAQCLIRAGRLEEAKASLKSVIGERKVSVLMLYAKLRKDNPELQFACVQWALRSCALTDWPNDLLKAYVTSPAARARLDQWLPYARTAALSPKENDSPILELLRVNAWVRYSEGNLTQAIADQELAAMCYRRLERENSPYRRHHDAEWDAFYTLARMHFESRPANYGKAYDAIVEAERYAVLGIKHEKLLSPNPALGFVGGEVVPTEFPERLRPLWQLSAILHLAVGDFRNIDLRVLASLPPQQWSPHDLQTEKTALAKIAFQSLGVIPKNMRPQHYYQLVHMAGIPTSQMQIEDPESEP
ncbi:MAG TPA: O-antigen ligase family protein [Phycisphaerae bacterium]|nr:O-antigen ligase family protein [Phycisphaerae bacterium]